MQYIVPDKVNFLTVFYSLSLKQPPLFFNKKGKTIGE